MADHDHNHPHDPGHSHGHAHDPAHRRAEPSVVTTDPAQQSLSDALRVSFWLLRFVMIALVVVYLLFSGMYQVAENEAAVVSRFGKIVEAGDGTQIRKPGFYFGPPFPIQEVIKVPLAEQTVAVAQAFMYEPAASAAAETGRPLNPEKDGSLITGDANIVHARFDVTYRVSDPVKFIRNIGGMETVVQDEEWINTPTGRMITRPRLTGRQYAEQLVVNMTEQGVVHAVANVSADNFIGGRFAADEARTIAQRQLDELEVGLTINNITIGRPEMPVSVRDAYDLVSQAEAQRGTLVNDAEKERTKLLGEAAGKAALPVEGQDGPLVQLIKDYEIATAVEDNARLVELGTQLRDAFRNLKIEAGDASGGSQTFDLGGETATIMNTALIDKSNITQRIQTEAQTVLKLKERYEADPVLFQQLMWQSAARDIFKEGSGIELFYAPAGSALYLEMNRDPEITRTKERARLEAQPQQ